ncbi:S8 family peptidase [Cellulomonas humilata]|uniref:Subtilisin family serine protease n=1 Tax=Cellulomonas humilata TaxID=144055 RepID=A0ABU0EF72_9CELL|nr:S8 family serine peptidase [Cellulomonas humilata]MDQ0373924.1 subtilisin family serine protease [Cellulomonas humilata]
MTTRQPAPPWAAPGDRQYSLPTSLLVKLALGEAPEHVPAVRDVVRGAQTAASSIDAGAIDRIIGERTGGFRAARLFDAAGGPHRPGTGHLGYDSVEQTTGIARTLILRVPSGTRVGLLCETLAQIPQVESASPNYLTVTPFRTLAPLAPRTEDDDGWAARRMVRQTEAHAVEPGDDGVVVGIVDSGVSRRHAELAHSLRAGFDTVRLESADLAPGIGLLGDHRRDDENPEDHFVGHGMGCAGIIAAQGHAMPRGLGGSCRIIPMRALAAARLPGRPAAIGLGSLSDLDLAVKLAVDLGAKVINMSFGTDDAALAPHSPKPHADVIAYALERGCILIAASGNNGRETRYWPAAYPGVIAVGAVADDGLPAAFSTRGDHVALCAPGEHVLTTTIDDGYQYATGTSFAAPFAAGAAALLVARSHRRARPIDAETVRRILMRTAQPFATGEHGGCGAGVLDAAAALTALDHELDGPPGDQARADGGADDD